MVKAPGKEKQTNKQTKTMCKASRVRVALNFPRAKLETCQALVRLLTTWFVQMLNDIEKIYFIYTQ
jgi:hypothetical protein